MCLKQEKQSKVAANEMNTAYMMADFKPLKHCQWEFA